MKLLFLIPITLSFFVIPVYGQLLSDSTGLVNRLDVSTGGHNFEVETVSNFDIQDFSFDGDEKKLTLFITSGLEKNLGEIIIPQSLLGGNFTFYLNDQEFFPKIKHNEKITFVTLNFTGSGNNTLEIFGTTYLNGLSVVEKSNDIIVSESNEGSGCLIATATFGSELAPQVQQLREIRDNQLMKTAAGTSFMTGFNQLYYSFSPTIADFERENPAFKEIVKIGITPLLYSLSIMSLADSEYTVLGYGLSIIVINIGMYFVAPILVIIHIHKKSNS